MFSDVTTLHDDVTSSDKYKIVNDKSNFVTPKKLIETEKNNFSSIYTS